MRTTLYGVGCILLFGVSLYAQNLEKEDTTEIESNVLHRLRQLHLEGSVHIFAVGSKGDRVYATAVLQDGVDRLWRDIHQNRKRWNKNPEIWTWISHGRAAESWRTPKNASLQVTTRYLIDGSRLYELDIDNWAPRGIKTPVNSVRHVFAEVWWNNIFHRSTNEDRIAHTLSLIDQRNLGGN